MSLNRRPRAWRGALRIVAGLGLLAGSLSVVEAAREAPAAAYPSTDVALTGHGFGHGHGMGQFGAFGYALAGWSWQQILAWYYGGTADGAPPGPNPNPGIAVDLSAFHGAFTIVQQERGQITVTSAAGPIAVPTQPGSQIALMIAPVSTAGSGQFAVYSGPTCGGGWTPVAGAGNVQGPVTVAPTTDTVSSTANDHAQMIQACPPDGSHHWYRGSLQATVSGTSPRTLNLLPVDAYLRGVVPRESPASWGTMPSTSNPLGENALEAQAVAARTYTLVHSQPICDTTSCQVYGGRAFQDSTGYFDLEGAGIYLTTTDAAVSATSGHVRLYTSAPRAGILAFTEYSSSTGGYTAPTSFPAVPDAGDATPSNPNHDWSTTISAADVQTTYCAGGQTLQAVNVTGRNGLGQDGGRVTQVSIQCGSTILTDTGDSFASNFGLMSNWFSISNSPAGGVAGYWLVATDGGIFSFGGAAFHGSTGAMHLNRPIVGMASTPDGNGYWLVASDGGIFTFGDGPFLGSTGAMHLNKPIVGMARTRSGQGYWLVASDGGIFTFGDAGFYGSTGALHLNKPVVGMATTPSGHGYWLVASDGGIFTFGDAAFYGSTGAMALNRPIVGMAAAPAGGGYRLVGADGGIFTFGNAAYYGSLPGLGITDTVGAVAPTVDGLGYLMAGASGTLYSFGDAPNFGGIPLQVPGYRGTVLGMSVQPLPGSK